MDPELLQQLFAQQDATANPPLESEDGSVGIGDLINNIITGLDPTMGIASGAAGFKPTKEMLGVQLLAGLLGPGMPADEASTFFKAVFSRLRGVKSPEEAVNVGGMVVQDMNQIERAMSGAPSEVIFDPKNQGALAEFERATDFIDDDMAMIFGDDIQRTLDTEKMLDSRLTAEMRARAATGDPIAVDYFTTRSNTAPDIISALSGKAVDVTSAGVDEFGEQIFDYFPRGVNSDVLNQKISDFSVLKALLNAGR